MGKQFQPGNPGRPKGAKNKATRDIKDLIQRQINFEELNLVLLDKAKAGEKWAFEMLYQYGFGKPVEIQIAPVTLSTDDKKPIQHEHKHSLDDSTTSALVRLAQKFADR